MGADGEWLIPVIRGTEFESEEEAEGYLVADNRSVELGGWDETVLSQVLADFAAHDALEGTGFDGDDLDALLRDLGMFGEPPEDPGAQIDRADELQAKWQVERGQIWDIPSLSVSGKSHRVMCGDSMSEGDVERLFGNDCAEMVWTDPPYGVSYGEKNRYLQSIGPADRLLGDIEGDTNSPEETGELVTSALSRFAAHAQPGAVAYLAAPAGPLHSRFIRAMDESGFEYRHQLIWLKNQLVFGRCDYMYKHEPILYGWLQNGAHYFEPITNNCTVFEFPRPRASKLHPTEKPVELVAAMIQNSSHRAGVVADAFLGSGTTMVAAEQTGRICYGMEISEKYVAVTLERMADMGLAPERPGV